MHYTFNQVTRFIFAFIFVAVVFFPGTCLGQSYFIHHYTESDGLPSDTVYGIVQDQLGRMWFATRAGIAMYDGVDWESYSVKDGLPTLSIFKLAVDRQGRIWALSYASSSSLKLSHSVPGDMGVQGRIRWLPVKSAESKKREALKPVALALWEPGNRPEPVVAVATRANGVFVRKDGQWVHIDETTGLLSNETYGIVNLGDRFFVATAHGLSVIHNGLRVDNSLNGALNLPFKKIKGITLEAEDRFPESPLVRDRMWLYGEKQLAYFDVDKNASGDMHTTGSATVLHVGRLLSGDRRPTLLQPDFRTGLYAGDTYTVTYFNYRTTAWESIRSANGLVSDGSNGMFIDFEKNIWIACGRGVSKISSRRFSNIRKTHGFLEDEVSAILEIEPGKILLGHNTGVSFYQKGDSRGLSFGEINDVPAGLVRVLDMKKDVQGNVWMALSHGGVLKMDRSQRFTRYWKNRFNTDATSLCFDQDGTLWLGTTRGIFHTTRAGGAPELEIIGGFPGIHVRRLFGDRTGMWGAAALHNGVFLYNRKTGQWENVQVPDTPKANNVYALHKDRNGRILVGTLDGLYILENGVIRRPGQDEEPLLKRPVYFIFEDNKQRLWFGTNNGVTRWDGREARTYSTPEGLVGRETNRAAIIQDSQDRIWIGTNRGVSIYDETFDNSRRFNPRPRIHLRGLLPQASGEWVSLSGDRPVQLSYKENTFEIHFRGIAFGDEQAIRFKSKLEGLDDEWTAESHPYKQTIRYTNLVPGSYRFHINVRNSRGIWSDIASSPEIIVLTPFYQQWWFIFLGLLIAGGVIVLLVRYIMGRRHAVILEQQVEERTKQLKETQQQLVQAQKMEAIGTLAGGIAHDFNNILGVIVGYSELTLEDLPEDHEVRPSVSEVLRAAGRATELVRQILAFSRQTERKRVVLALGPLVKEALKLLRSTLPATIDIRKDIRSVNGTVLADATQMHQVLMNLGANAAHAMKDKGGLLEVVLEEVVLDADSTPAESELLPGSYVRLIVSDTGHGIPNVVMKRIFEPYFTTKETGEGTGLGLAVIHGIIKGHSGDIFVFSEPGKGSSFHVYLPLVKGEAETVKETETEITGGNEHILLVEDEESLARVSRQILERLGYRVTYKADPVEALATFKKNPDQFHLIISDVTMPRMTGIQLAGKVMRIRPGMPVVLCSGFSASATREQLARHGVKHFVMKPLIKSELARVVRTALDERGGLD